MKKLRSSDDLDSSGGEKAVVKDWVRRDEDSGFHRSSSSSLHRSSSYYKSSDSSRKVISSSTPRYDRLEDDRETSRNVRKRADYDVDSYDRRKSYDRHRDGNDRGILSSSPRAGYGMDRMYRSESFSGPRRDFPKGFRSERDRPRREGSVTSWRKYGNGKDFDDGVGRGSRTDFEDVSKVKSSPRPHRDVRSPGWSKDSGSERSKSIEVKKNEDMPPSMVVSGHNNEREEGELEPEPHPPVPVTNPVIKRTEVYVEPNRNVDESIWKEEASSVPAENTEPAKIEERVEVAKDDDVLECSNTSLGNENEATGESEGDNNVIEGKRAVVDSEKGISDDTPASLQDQEKDKGSDFAMNVKDIEMTEDASEIVKSPAKEEISESWKEKGRSVSLLPYCSDHMAETSAAAEMEGSSTRGFQFFSFDPIKKLDNVEQSSSHDHKPKDDNKLALDLSLRLPNVLLPLGLQNREQAAPGSPSHARSMQSFPSSFRALSDGFTASMSFSGSQQFTHNPSCSMTYNNANDFEKSVGSKPLFQGVDWKALASDEIKNKELPAYLRFNGGSSKQRVGLERQLSADQNLSGSHRVGSCENGMEMSKDRKLVIHGKEQVLAIGPDSVESIITMLVSEAILTVAQKFNDIGDQLISSVKEFVRDIITTPAKQWQLNGLQKRLRKISDISPDMLANANRAQLEILVALKTGIQGFLVRKIELAPSDLAEIFLNMKCRNLSCGSLLPVDECDCRICSRKDGFCRECMCLVCSKFDTASNTCSWVGCDVCMHWCHVDCGLQESHIRNGFSASGAQKRTEMQSHCIACDHPSEMFGFVKEVFQNFVKDWTVENLYRELEYVRRIFNTSEDVRGRQLHEIANLMLSKLGNRADVQDVKNHVMKFFFESDSHNPGKFPLETAKKTPAKSQERSNGFAEFSKEKHGWTKSTYPEKVITPFVNSSNNIIPDFDTSWREKHTMNVDLRTEAHMQPVFDELESHVRVKLAEAEMFQARADEARRESEALRRISIAKNEKIEEEYASRIAKLRLDEAEEMRRAKVEELQSFERAHQEYFNMKMRMETDIKDLLLKMESTRRNLI